MFLLSKMCVAVCVWRLSEARVILRDGHMFISHWATHGATLRRRRRDKTATQGGKNLDTDQRISVFSHSSSVSPPFFRPPFLPLHETGSQSTGGLLDEGEDDMKLPEQVLPNRGGF